MTCVGPKKKLKKKIDMWKQISSDMEDTFNVKYNYIQVENRYKTVCKRKNYN